MSKQPPPAPTASAVGPCPTVIKIVGRPGTESLPSTFAPPDHPQILRKYCDIFKIRSFVTVYFILWHIIIFVNKLLSNA